MAKEVVFVADDFGMSPEINDAILHAHISGQLGAAALMMGQPGTDEAVALARRHPRLQVGWHLHLTDSIPTTIARWPWNSSPTRAGWAIGLLPSARRLMQNEIARQWELFRATGLECRFLNAHHHLHVHPFVARAMRKVVGDRFPGWIRLGRPRWFDQKNLETVGFFYALLFQRHRRLSPWRAADTFWGLDRLFRMNADEIRPVLAALPDGFHEFMFHPHTRTCPDTLCLIDLKTS